jgi:uncharacterized membrane protein
LVSINLVKNMGNFEAFLFGMIVSPLFIVGVLVRIGHGRDLLEFWHRVVAREVVIQPDGTTRPK